VISFFAGCGGLDLGFKTSEAITVVKTLLTIR